MEKIYICCIFKIFLFLYVSTVLSYVYRSAKFDAKFINYFARLYTLFYRLPIYETFRTESKIK